MNDVPHLLHVDLELEIGSDPIRGRLGLDPATGREFRGWIELAAALDAVFTGSPAAGGAEDYASGDGA